MRWYGQVKWFKDHKGYGFIIVMGRCPDAGGPGPDAGGSGPDAGGSDPDADCDLPLGKEVFVHHTDIQPALSTYKTLIKGEYVSFGLKRVQRPRGSLEAADVQASDVRGAYGGGLMCDGLNVGAMSRTLECTTPTVLHNGDIMFAACDEVIL